MWDARRVIQDRDGAVASALVAEVARKSALVWLRPADDEHGPAVAAWHVWYDDAVHLVSGGDEQSLPDFPDGTEVDVIARSKDTGGRVVTFRATVSTVRPGTEAWEPVVRELHAKRLNPRDGEEQPARWARESRVVRLSPTGRLVERPGHFTHRSHAAEPVATPATTRGRLPFILGRRARHRRLP
jgi:hypothetical protein